MTLTDRVVTIFGQVAIAAGAYEATHKRVPTYVCLSAADAAALKEYLESSDAAVGFNPAPISMTTRAHSKRQLVSGLVVRVFPTLASPAVC